jgi:hypothetical protein
LPHHAAPHRRFFARKYLRGGVQSSPSSLGSYFRQRLALHQRTKDRETRDMNINNEAAASPMHFWAAHRSLLLELCNEQGEPLCLYNPGLAEELLALPSLWRDVFGLLGRFAGPSDLIVVSISRNCTLVRVWNRKYGVRFASKIPQCNARCAAGGVPPFFMVPVGSLIDGYSEWHPPRCGSRMATCIYFGPSTFLLASSIAAFNWRGTR